MVEPMRRQASRDLSALPESRCPNGQTREKRSHLPLHVPDHILLLPNFMQAAAEKLQRWWHHRSNSPGLRIALGLTPSHRLASDAESKIARWGQGGQGRGASARHAGQPCVPACVHSLSDLGRWSCFSWAALVFCEDDATSIVLSDEDSEASVHWVPIAD